MTPLYRRRRPDLDYTRIHPQEYNPPCIAQGNNARAIPIVTVIIMLINMPCF
ncbi:unnamed protein product [Toxocara canis]|uniref:Uncharacterized protein n=1 Tax=Toxocara canis TaxID=6265 RepID=A0A183UT06_TOXCA|nr:unnamed protein product [Toxocara canis]